MSMLHMILPPSHPKLDSSATSSVNKAELRTSRSTVGSQFVELSSLAAIPGAVLLERQNREIFDAATLQV